MKFTVFPAVVAAWFIIKVLAPALLQGVVDVSAAVQAVWTPEPALTFVATIVTGLTGGVVSHAST